MHVVERRPAGLVRHHDAGVVDDHHRARTDATDTASGATASAAARRPRRSGPTSARDRARPAASAVISTCGSVDAPSWSPARCRRRRRDRRRGRDAAGEGRLGGGAENRAWPHPASNDDGNDQPRARAGTPRANVPTSSAHAGHHGGSRAEIARSRIRSDHEPQQFGPDASAAERRQLLLGRQHRLEQVAQLRRPVPARRRW